MVETLSDKQTVPKSHRDDPQTSYDAADKAAHTRRWWYQQIYCALKAKDCPQGNTAKSIASYIAATNTMNYYEAYYWVQRRLSEMKRHGWIFRKEIRGRECCPWWAVFGKESEVWNGENRSP